MSKKILWRDILQSIRKSKGRFLSIFGLMLLGSFALVGLKVAGPDMQITEANYAKRLNAADLTVVSNYGLDKSDREILNDTKGLKKVEYGYLKDVVVKNTKTSFRLFSAPKSISTYEVKKGRLPQHNDEIALDYQYASDYKVGQTIRFSEKADATGNKVLRRTNFKIVGFVYSGEILSDVNLGQTTAGTGELKGYAVVLPAVFDSDVYMTARMTFTNLANVNPYTDTYQDRLQAHKDKLNQELKSQPTQRLAAIKATAQKLVTKNQRKLDDAQQKLDDAKTKLSAARKQLDAGAAEIKTKQQELDTKVAAANKKLADGAAQLKQAQSQLTTAQQQLTQAKVQLDAGQKTLTSKQQELAAAKQKLQTAKTQLDQAQQQLTSAKQQIATGQATLTSKQRELNQSKQQLIAANQQYTAGIAQLQQGLAAITQQLQTPNLPEAQQAALKQKQAELQAQLQQTQVKYADFKNTTYNPGLQKIAAGQKELTANQQTLQQKQHELQQGQATYNTKLATYQQGQQQYQKGATELAQGEQTLAQKTQLYQENLAKYQAGQKSFQQKQAELAQGKAELATQKANGEQQLATARTTLAQKESEYQQQEQKYQDQAPTARREIAAGQATLTNAKRKIKQLTAPVYSLNSRREMPGGEGYKIYTTVSEIVAALANVFPIFFYFVAALVTFTTMGRFVDEERINSGTLRALGYDNRDVIRKFTFYSFMSSMLGTLAGVILGHTLLPLIIHNAYHSGFTIPEIELHFHLGITLVAFALALLSAVLPAYIAAKSELNASAAELLLPKPPAAGSKILLERITPIWRRMSFTHKVTARNIFRYKKRMLMTIFGVAGAVALLFTGYSVRNSVAGMSETQFGDIIHYNMIVAQNDHLTADQKTDYQNLLHGQAIAQQAPVHYEELTKVAGANHDNQEIKLIVPQTTKHFNDYIDVRARKSHDKITFSNDGVIISERLSTLLNVKVGDTITIKDADNQSRKIKISGITEMYMGHFILMNQSAYQKFFSTKYQTNGNLIILKNGSRNNTETQAAKFMKLSATAGVVQNTTLTNQIATIVKSLSKIMMVLIIVAALLAIVILYNLTNINVSERIRELSTVKVLGFFDNEVTMYIYRETILLTLIGILAGFGIGDVLYRYILAVVPPDDVMFNPALAGLSFLRPVVMIGLITAILGLVVNRKLRNIDMLEALKSVD
ncbi:FtsX-like permease family protein [Lapidilactobacillus bayanensis]|uniref:FtsX-like permease family protein n=1 Tax=Lapidilactobacillus bayanensis TaxID=2485998 RepID=UPI000F7AB027|nr:FtsX-like permease family protein [Lapidilactobacillus bayanensis]